MANTLMMVRFYAQAGGGGDLVGTASATVPVAEDGTISTTIATEGVVQTVEVPADQSLSVGETRTLQFGAKSQDGDLVAVTPGSATWAVVSGGEKLTLNGGDATGVAAGNAQVTATVDGKTSPPASVSVVAPEEVAVTIAPTTVWLAPSATRQFTATVTGTANQSVTWSVVGANGGTVTETGLYTAPVTDGTYTVRVTSVQDPTKSAQASVTVQSPSFKTIGRMLTPEGGLPAVQMLNAISGDGSTVGGALSVRYYWNAAYWTEATGWVNISPQQAYSVVSAIDATGTNFAANDFLDHGSVVAYRWRVGGQRTEIPHLDPTRRSPYLYAISDDGNTIYGTDRSTDPVIGVRWTEAGGLVEVARHLDLRAASADGQVLGGSFGSQGALWTAGGGFETLGTNGAVQFLSASGDQAASALHYWTRDEGLRSFPNDAKVRSMSRNGKYVIYTNVTGAYYWSAEGGTVPLATLLEAAGAPAGLRYQRNDGTHLLSADGRTIVGTYAKDAGATAPLYVYHCRLAPSP
ncbi:MAG: hypothetical protein ACO1SV_00730 [Fimbriimonas sp.]